MIRPLLALLLLSTPIAAASSGPFEITAQATELRAKPQTVAVFPVTFTSRSEESVKLVFEVARADEAFQAVPPMPVVLQGAGKPIDRLDVPFVVHTPFHNGYVDDTGTITYRITPTDPRTGEPVADAQELTLTVHARGMYVPGPQLFAAMFALGVAALVLRRRR